MNVNQIRENTAYRDVRGKTRFVEKMERNRYGTLMVFYYIVRHGDRNHFVTSVHTFAENVKGYTHRGNQTSFGKRPEVYEGLQGDSAGSASEDTGESAGQ